MAQRSLKILDQEVEIGDFPFCSVIAKARAIEEERKSPRVVGDCFLCQRIDSRRKRA
jgi:hypothetical protein